MEKNDAFPNLADHFQKYVHFKLLKKYVSYNEQEKLYGVFENVIMTPLLSFSKYLDLTMVLDQCKTFFENRSNFYLIDSYQLTRFVLLFTTTYEKIS